MFPGLLAVGLGVWLEDTLYRSCPCYMAASSINRRCVNLRGTSAACLSHDLVVIEAHEVDEGNYSLVIRADRRGRTLGPTSWVFRDARSWGEGGRGLLSRDLARHYCDDTEFRRPGCGQGTMVTGARLACGRDSTE